MADNRPEWRDRPAYDEYLWFTRWDESDQAQRNSADLHVLLESLTTLVSQEDFAAAWYKAKAEMSVVMADRAWRSCLPLDHPHYFEWVALGTDKFLGVEPYDRKKDEQMGPVEGEHDTWKELSEAVTKFSDPHAKPTPTKRPLTDEEKFNYRIRKMFEQEKARYVS